MSNCLMCLYTNEKPRLDVEEKNDISGVQRHIMYSQCGWLQSKHEALGSNHTEVSLSESHHNVVQPSRNVLGTKNLGDILSERESIAHDMQVLVKGKNHEFFCRKFCNYSFVKMKVLSFWISRPKPHIVRGSRWPWTRPQNLGESKLKGLRWGGRYFFSCHIRIIWIVIEIADSFCAIRSFSVRSSHIYIHHQKVKDVRLPVQLQRAMAAEAEAAREARAKVTSRHGHR